MNKKLPLYLQICISMACGIAIGLFAGPKAAPLGDLAKVVIQLIKTLAAPLLFFAVIDAFLRERIEAKSGFRLIAISATNAAVAVAIGLTISNVWQPGAHLILPANLSQMPQAKVPVVDGKIDFMATLAGYLPTSLVQPFLDNSVISLVILAVLLGVSLRRVKTRNEAGGRSDHVALERAVATLLGAFEMLLGGVIRLVPFAVFGAVAKVVGEQGFAPLKGLAAYVGTVLFGLALHIGITYQAWIVFVAKMKLKDFWRGARDPVVYVLGASSSLATLPVTLNSLGRMGVSPASSRLAACVGTNLNNDGILLYEALAILFVAQAHGIHLSVGQQAVAALSCVIAGVGITGVPEAGLVSLALALSTVGLPTEILPLLLTVDWILGRARAATNVVSDMLGAVLLDRLGRNDQRPPLKSA